MKDPATGQTGVDPHYNPQYTQFCYVFQYLPGKTTYLDTLVLPIAALPARRSTRSTEQPDGTPGIKMVTQFRRRGYWAVRGCRQAGAAPRIHAMGLTRVSNPLYDQNDARHAGVNAGAEDHRAQLRLRDGPGQVFIGGTAVTVTPANWSDAASGQRAGQRVRHRGSGWRRQRRVERCAA